MVSFQQRAAFNALSTVAQLVRPMFADLVVTRDGAEPFDPLPPCVIAANHRSFFDVPVGFEYFGRAGAAPAIVVADRFFATPVVGPLLASVGALRAKKGGADELRLAALAELRRGRPVAIFPEGRLVPKGERLTGVGQAYSTIIDIARDGNVPIIPIGVAGSDVVWPLHQQWPRLARPRPTVTARIGAPMWVGADEDNAGALARLMDEIAEMIDEES